MLAEPAISLLEIKLRKKIKITNSIFDKSEKIREKNIIQLKKFLNQGDKIAV